ncbi:MAG TPA: hypothetical protein VG722_02545, partial [Tepidisphaeraceae bacterium]|nr:hypothetical protein [Tepidisphaeraceae bacterium]
HYLLAMELHAGPWAGMFLAQWMHGVFIVLTIFAIYAAVRLFASPFAATLAAIGAGFCPWLSMLGAVAYDEGGLLLYTTLAIAWLIVQRTRNDERRMANEEQSPFVRIYHAAIIAGICAGFACGCKLTAVPITLIALPIIFFVCKPTKRALSASLIFGFVGLLAFSPWLIRNQFWANNPVFPEGMSVFSHAYFSPIQIARWHQAHSPRPDQQSIAAHFQAFWEQVISDWQYAYALLPLSILAALTALRRRLAWFLLLIFLAIFLFWIGLTHLESRFFVLAIPMMALLLAVGNPKLLRWAVIPVIFSAIPAFMGLDQRLRLSHLSLTIGLESPTLLRAEIYPKEVNDAIAENKPVILVGDAKAFWFNIPMSRLHYRTVFDVDTSDHRSVVSAWINGAANLKDANVIIDPGELARFHKTYLGIPPLPPSLKYLREPTVFDLHDSQIQE